jgi:hypothetical protein
MRIPGDSEKDSGINVKSVPGMKANGFRPSPELAFAMPGIRT